MAASQGTALVFNDKCRLIGIWISVLAGGLIAGGGARAQTASAQIKSFKMVRASTPPVIDGQLDDPVWSTAAVISDLHQLDPYEFSEPSERSDFYVLYDDDALYIGAHMWTSDPQNITANTMRQGAAIGNDDQLILILDPYNNQRDGYQFQVNPNGVRYDGIFVGPSIMQWNWDGIWDAVTSRDDSGWTAEVVIPFKTLSFNRETDTWGINFGRRAQAMNERMAWVSRNRQQTPSIAGRATGITGINQGIGLDIVPSASITQTRNFAPAASDTDLEPSVDVFYKLTPSLSGSLTINTDFSATEVDDRQVNLTRFGLILSGKTRFFSPGRGCVRVRRYRLSAELQFPVQDSRAECTAILLAAHRAERSGSTRRAQIRCKAQRPCRALDPRSIGNSPGRIPGHRGNGSLRRPRGPERARRIERRGHRHGRRPAHQS